MTRLKKVSATLAALLCASAVFAQYPANYDENKVPDYQLPDVLLNEAGKRVATSAQWQKRRAEIIELLCKQMYGFAPSTDDVVMRAELLEESPDAFGSLATRRQIDLHLSPASHRQTGQHLSPASNRLTDLHLSPARTLTAKGAGAGEDTVCSGQVCGDGCVAGESVIRLLIYTPNHVSGPAPAFLGINFFGNAATTDDPVVFEFTENQLNALLVDPKAKAPVRNEDSRRWPYEYILQKGYAVVTYFRGDVDPDVDDGFRNGVHGVFDNFAVREPGSASAVRQASADDLRKEGRATAEGTASERPGDAWGTVAAWAWSLSRVMDFLETQNYIDAKRIAVHGHSRLGKAAVWAGATDSRFAVVISNNSGCGGAALSKRVFGENTGIINEKFPHWFCANYHKYGGHDELLPFDQHFLLSLVAPRPLYVASADLDRWSDPRGEFLGLVEASKVYKQIYGYDGLEGFDWPRYGSLATDRLGYHIREGKHDILLFDWMHYITFCDRFLK